MDLESNQATAHFTTISRELKTNLVRVLIDGKDTEISLKDFQKNYGAFGLIRITKDEFNYIENQEIKQLTHFNLQSSNHKIGEKYLLVKIIEHGDFDGKTNQTLPLLDLSNPQLFKCIECEENITYDNLKPEIFKNSFPDIKNITELKEAIIKRYSKSMSFLKKEEILELGTSITKLERVEANKNK